MTRMVDFAASKRSTVGLEWELALVDADSGDLRQAGPAVVAALDPGPTHEHPRVHAEFLRSAVEIVSGVSATVGEAGADLARTLAEVRAVTDPLRVELLCAGTHPFARWAEQKLTDKDRYRTVVDRAQIWGRQMAIYGAHVHVGVEDRERVMPIIRSLLVYHPYLLALSASSPFFDGQDTGYASQRAMLFQQLPTAGLPYQFATWAELERYVADLRHTGVIEDFNDIRWDIRPAPRFGTIEVRVSDGASTHAELLALAALTHCLVEHLSTLIDLGRPLPALPQWFVAENKWRAARYGLEAVVILDDAGTQAPVADATRRLVAELRPTAQRLGCVAELDGVLDILDRGASYQRQRAVAAAYGPGHGSTGRVGAGHGSTGHKGAGHGSTGRRGAGHGSTEPAGYGRERLEAVVAHLVAELRAGHPLPPAPAG